MCLLRNFLARGRSPRASSKRASTAFTLVELLVVVAIIGLLVALLMPAVQSAREAARRTACSNNLHQMGVALTAFHSAHGAFPEGGLEWRGPYTPPENRQLSWCVFILPHLEETAVYDALDLSKAFDSAANAEAAATIISGFVCPTSPRGLKLVEGRGPCDYGGIFGQRFEHHIVPENPHPEGIMRYDERIAARQITDGLSQTLIVGEDTGFADGQWINGRNVFDQSHRINAAPPSENDLRSEHPGGAQAVFADGSASFLHESLDEIVLAAICTRAGGEVVSTGVH